jgi:hypothetical protein
VLVGTEQFMCEEAHMLLKLFDLFSLGVIVADGLVSDLGCLAGIGQRAQILLKVSVGWVQTRYHATERVATQTLT